MYENIIFDLDGTLLDTLDDLTDAVNAALDACGLKRRTREEVRAFVGNGIAKLMERAVGEEGRALSEKALAVRMDGRTARDAKPHVTAWTPAGHIASRSLFKAMQS